MNATVNIICYKQKTLKNAQHPLMIRDMKKSINDVTDPTKNAINEKCSRIREAFVKHFDEQIAKNYFITGTRSEPKKIILPRDLIMWKTEV